MRVLTLLFLTLSFAGAPASAQSEACGRFAAALDLVPHLSLKAREGELEWMADGTTVAGCEVRLETREDMVEGTGLPTLLPDPGTELYQAGWRLEPEFLADGPGSGMHGMRRGSVLCLVSRDQPAYLDDDGSVVQSETITLVIQCRAT